MGETMKNAKVMLDKNKNDRIMMINQLNTLEDKLNETTGRNRDLTATLEIFQQKYHVINPEQVKAILARVKV